MARVSPQQPLLLIQVLRAIAALMVVVHHASGLGPRHSWYTQWGNGAAGVDIFFVISGFIMAYSSRSLVGKARPGWQFFVRRIERIYPIYWLLTTVKVVMTVAVPRMERTGLGGPAYLIGSFLLLPLRSGKSGILPVLTWGWTLMFEMLFYILFATALSMRIRPPRALGPVLVAISVVAFWVHTPAMPLGAYFDPIMLEFLFGMVLFEAYVWLQGGERGVPGWVGYVLAAAGFVVLFVTPDQDFTPERPFIWGLPALAVVAGALLLEPQLGRAVPRWLMHLGDQSYSLYLVHVFVLALVAPVFLRLHLEHGFVAGTYPVVATGLAVVAAWMLYKFVEHPCIRYFRGRRRAAVESGT